MQNNGQYGHQSGTLARLQPHDLERDSLMDWKPVQLPQK